MSDKPRRDLSPLGDVLDVVLGRFAGPGHASRAELFSKWDDIAGPVWAGTRPIKIDTKAVLVVEVPDGGVASRLRFEVSGLVARIAAELGDGTVESVRLRVGRNRA